MIRALVASVILAAVVAGGAEAGAVQPAAKSAGQIAAKPLSAYDKCLASPAGQSTVGMIDCAAAELAIQDARLNRAYQVALARLDRPRQKMALQKAQRAWIAFRDADCASRYDEDWGSISRVEANLCVLDSTRDRAVALEGFHKGF